MSFQSDLYRNLPGLHLAGHRAVTDMARLHLRGGEAIIIARDHLRQEVADLLVTEPRFFTMEELPGLGVLDIRFDCRVVTTEELRAALLEAYRTGVQEGAYRR